jgi:uncharacterized cupredoxin-like copper-binding protein
MVSTIIVAILLIASLSVFVVLPALSPPATKVFKFDLVAQDFAYDRIGFNPSFTVDANKPIWFVFSNNGTNVHEFLLYRINQTTTRDSILAYAYQDLAAAQADWPQWASNETQKNLTLDDYNTRHDGDDRLTRYNGVDRNVDPGATTDLVFVIREAGNYFFVCHQVDTSVMPWKIHQDHGMWGLLTVNA